MISLSFDFVSEAAHSAIAQSVERFPVKEDVPGSSPGRGAMNHVGFMAVHST